MLFDPARHEPLQAIAWSEERAHATVQRIVDDAEAHFDEARAQWPGHPRDAYPGEPADHAHTPLYHGACGVIWALHRLQDLGRVRLRRDYVPFLDTVLAANRQWLHEVGDAAAPSYLMGDVPFLLQQHARAPADARHAQALAQLIARNTHHPHRELMWGAPGTALAALHLHAHTGDGSWAALFRQSAAALREDLLWSDTFQCHYWQQDMYGRQSTYLDGVHGFVATAFVLIKGRHLLSAEDWDFWQQCITQTMARTASVEGDLANWRAHLITPAGEAPRLLVQFCHGAPGFVICLAELPGSDLDEVLRKAGNTVWAAGPLPKGPNLCHGTAGNGYAFLKLHQRTGEALWLQRARAFAMHSIAQWEAEQVRYGQGQYSLWTGDVGLAFYLLDCISGVPCFPTLDEFFPPASRAA